jgi:hypothetical protein
MNWGLGSEGLWQVVGTIGAATAISKFMVCATLVSFRGHICFLVCKLCYLKSLGLMDFFQEQQCASTQNAHCLLK